MKTYYQFINEATIGDFFKNQAEIFVDNQKEDKQLFFDCKTLGKKILDDSAIVLKCKNYIISLNYGVKEQDIELNFYEPENIIVGIIPDGTLKKIGKTGQSVSMRKTNMIVFEKSQWQNDVEGWIIHEVGHVISWRDYKDSPKIKNEFITGSNFDANSNVFNPKDCFNGDEYPNVWLEYIPFTNQIKYLLKSNTPENIIRLIMKDYETAYVGERKNDLIKNEQIFINYLNCVLGKKSDVKNKYKKV
jgi:hypothetical protein